MNWGLTSLFEKYHTTKEEKYVPLLAMNDRQPSDHCSSLTVSASSKFTNYFQSSTTAVISYIDALIHHRDGHLGISNEHPQGHIFK